VWQDPTSGVQVSCLINQVLANLNLQAFAVYKKMCVGFDKIFSIVYALCLMIAGCAVTYRVYMCELESIIKE
jgi:hypothetical protein